MFQLCGGIINDESLNLSGYTSRRESWPDQFSYGGGWSETMLNHRGEEAEIASRGCRS